ncbi:MAG: hypothetical protein ONB31_16110 [candidate division KSB1 bacterium]|nr:hypothetical protein [candidate division KSB1 bacterium]MDZ7402461.1 hypothetical protein [candidate division KSB1 bacterium]
MKKISIFIVIAILSLLFYFCDKDNSINGIKIPAGAYAYTGYDSTGAKIVKGWIKIVFDDSITISGEWELDKIGDPKSIGPQVGSGTLMGALENHQLFLNLNPNYVDNNVFLTCAYDEKKLAGKWNYSGFPGIINYGTFLAEKK